MCALFQAEEKYQAAKARLEAAQRENLEAGFEFLSARAALRQGMEALWPDPAGHAAGTGEGAEAPQKAESGYDEVNHESFRQKCRA